MGIPSDNNKSGQNFSYEDHRAHFKSVNVTQGKTDWDQDYYLSMVKQWNRKSPTVYPGTSSVKGIKWKNPSSYFRSIVSFDWQPGEQTSTWQTWHPQTIVDSWSGVSNAGYSPVDWNPPWFGVYEGVMNTDAKSQCIVECLNKLNDSKVQLGQYIAESMKSAEMLADAGIHFLNLLSAVKRRDISYLRKMKVGFDDINSGFLQWKYGWAPLAADLHQLWKNAHEGLNRPQIISASRTVTTNYSGSYSPNGKKGSYSITHTDRCKMWAVLSDEFIANSQAYGLVNPLSLAWELVPFSFVVDWFAPIGDFLRSLTATAGLDFVAGYSSQTRDGTFQVPLVTVGDCKAKYFMFAREGYSGFPVAGVNFRPYALQSPFNAEKAGIIASLLAQLRRR